MRNALIGLSNALHTLARSVAVAAVAGMFVTVMIHLAARWAEPVGPATAPTETSLD